MFVLKFLSIDTFHEVEPKALTSQELTLKAGNILNLRIAEILEIFSFVSPVFHPPRNLNCMITLNPSIYKFSLLACIPYPKKIFQFLRV